MLNQPHHVRKKVALICTAVVAAVLLAIMIIYHAKPKEGEEVKKTTVFRDFYNTVLKDSSSLLNPN